MPGLIGEKPRLHIESLVVRFAMQEVMERVPTSSLTIEDARSAARVAWLHIEMSFQGRPRVIGDRTHRRPVG